MIEIYSFDNFHLYVLEKDIDKLTIKDRVYMFDNEGYKYFFNKSNISNIKKRKTIPARFFNLNPYAEYNIKLYLEKVSDGNVILEDFNNAKNAHSKLMLYNKSQDLHYDRSWNEISNGNYYYKKLDQDYVSSRRLDSKIVEEHLESHNLIMVGEYKNNITPIEFICRKHQDKGIQKMNWSTMHRSPCPCRYCKGFSTIAKTDEELRDEIKNKKNPNIEVIGRYKNMKTKIECKCRKCGRTIYLRPDHIKRGIGCGYCTKSIGENRVETFLKEHHIKYEREYRFEDCIRVKKSMPFDFYLSEINTVIEYDGVQHFQIIGRFGEESFRELKLNDKFKSNYCKEHNINLIRISYKEKDMVDKILSAKLLSL